MSKLDELFEKALQASDYVLAGERSRRSNKGRRYSIWLVFQRSWEHGHYLAPSYLGTASGIEHAKKIAKKALATSKNPMGGIWIKMVSPGQGPEAPDGLSYGINVLGDFRLDSLPNWPWQDFQSGVVRSKG